MRKLSRYGGTAIFLWGICAMVGFFMARTGGNAPWAHAFQKGLMGWVYVVFIAGGYMAAVGIYHTFLAVFGLDGEPGLFSRGRRTGPLSQPASLPVAGRDPWVKP